MLLLVNTFLNRAFRKLRLSETNAMYFVSDKYFNRDNISIENRINPFCPTDQNQCCRLLRSYPNKYVICYTYSRLSLSRSPSVSLKYFEIPIPRHIRFPELRKQPYFINEYVIWFLKLEIRAYKKSILQKRRKFAPEEQFLLFSTIVYYCCCISMLKQGPDFHFEKSGYSR